MKIFTSRSTFLLGLFLVLFTQTSIFAQWKKQSLPPLDDMLYFPVAKGKNTMWATTVNYANDPTRKGRLQAIRTLDGGKTYKTQVLFDDINAYIGAIYPYDEKIAYLLAAKHGEQTYFFRRTIDAGETWQDMPYKPTAFPDIVHFFNPQEGILISDPDSVGANIAFTTDGGTTYTRLPQSNVPLMDAKKDVFIIGGNFQVFGNTVFTTSVDITTGLWRVWRSTDRGRNWTAGEPFDSGDVFIPRVIFSDANNGLILRGHASTTTHSFYTDDGGATWQEGNIPPGQNTFMLNLIPNTQTMLSVFLDTKTQMQYSIASNDLGKTWNSRKDIQPYTLDSIFSPDLPPIVFTLGDVVDNNTAWAKFGRDGLYRYESTTPLAQENPDLDLVLKADNDGLPLYGSVKYTLTVTNRGISPATGIRINWLPPYKRTNNGVGPYAYQAAYSDKGRYDSWNGVWTLDKLDAGAIATASFHLFVLDNTKDVSQTAQVIATNEKDLDSSPNNMVGAAKEDDEIGYIAKAKNSTAEMPNDAFKAKMPEFAVSPNPAKDKIYVAINPVTDGEWSIRILNNIGQVVFNQNGQYNNRVEVDAKNFDAGLYLVEYQAQGERKVEKVMIQH